MALSESRLISQVLEFQPFHLGKGKGGGGKDQPACKTVIEHHEQKAKGGYQIVRTYATHTNLEPPVYVPPIDADIALARDLLSTLGNRYNFVPFLLGESDTTEPIIIRGVFNPEWIADLPLPIGENRPSDMEVTIWGEGHSMQRTVDSAALSV